MDTAEFDQPTARVRQIDTPELLFTAIFLPIAAFSWVGIFLAELGVFSGARMLAGGVLVSAVAVTAAARGYLRAGAPRAAVSRRTWVSLVLIAGLSAGLFSKPGEYLIEGADASVYLAIGRNIERTGRIIYSDPLIDVVPEDLRESFFPRDRLPPQNENRLPGGLRIAPDGRVTPGFFHLLPVWIATAASAAGPYGPYYVNPILAVLGVILVWLIGRRIWSPVAGVVAAFLLALNFGQIFHAGLPSSEMLAQFFLQAGIFFTVLAWDCRLRVFGACAGVAIGLAAFTRIDTLILMVPLAAGWLLLSRRERAHASAWRWYAALLAIVAGHAILHASTIAVIYTTGLFGDGWRQLSRLPQTLDAARIIGLIAAMAAAVFVAMKVRGRWLTGIGVAGMVAMGVLSPAVVVTTGRLLTPLGLAVALGGVGLALARGLNRRDLPAILPFLASAMLVLAWRETLTLPHDFRRAVPAILPGAMLLIGFVVAQARRMRGWPGYAIWIVPVGLAGLFIADSGHLLLKPLAQGIHAQFREVARHIPEDAVILSDRTVPGHVGTALQYTFNRPTLRMSSRPRDAARLTEVIHRVLATGRPTFAVVAPFAEDRTEGLMRKDLAAFAVPEELVFPVTYEVLRPVRGSFPREHRVDNLSLAVYRIEPRDTTTQTALPFTIDIGGDDFPFVIQGFHGRESSQSGNVRWTTGDSKLALPRFAGPKAGQMTLVLRFSAGRPPGLNPPVVTIAIDGREAGVISHTTAEMAEYRLPLSDEIVAVLCASPTMLTLTTDVFVPSAAGQNTDNRRLGIFLDWLRIE